MKTAFQRPKAGSYETGDKMSLTHHKQIDQIRPRLDVRSETPFQFCLSHAVHQTVVHFCHSLKNNITSQFELKVLTMLPAWGIFYNGKPFAVKLLTV